MMPSSSGPKNSSAVNCLFFDGDDTLWDNASNYERAHLEFLDLAEELGFDRELAGEMVSAKDKKLIEENRFGHRWYKRVLVETYRELSGLEEGQEDPKALRKIGQIIHENFSGRVILHEGVEDLLLSLQSPSRRLFLFTVGDVEIQSRKILTTGVARFFEAAFIGSSKTMEDYEALRQYLGVPAERCVMFGDSFYRDVLPSIEAGMAGVLIKTPMTWSYENLTEDLMKEILVLPGLKAIPLFLEQNGL